MFRFRFHRTPFIFQRKIHNIKAKGVILMKAFHPLPDGYKEILHINLQEDQKTALKINVFSIIAAIVVFLIGKLIAPSSSMLAMKLSSWLLLAAGFIVYMVLHEATHAIVMKAVGAKKVIFGFTGMYAFAGSKEDYFDKSSYRLIALAPVVVWGIIFAILAFVVPADYYWVLWLLQVANISGAAGDLYVTFRFWNFPPSILVMDTGIDMTVYDK